VENGGKWWKMVENGGKWWKMVENGGKWWKVNPILVVSYVSSNLKDYDLHHL